MESLHFTPRGRRGKNDAFLHIPILPTPLAPTPHARLSPFPRGRPFVPPRPHRTPPLSSPPNLAGPPGSRCSPQRPSNFSPTQLPYWAPPSGTTQLRNVKGVPTRTDPSSGEDNSSDLTYAQARTNPRSPASSLPALCAGLGTFCSAHTRQSPRVVLRAAWSRARTVAVRGLWPSSAPAWPKEGRGCRLDCLPGNSFSYGIHRT